MQVAITWENRQGQEIDSLITWDKEDPLAVTVIFGGEITDDPVIWRFSRDLIDDALGDNFGSWHGSGDVKVTKSFADDTFGLRLSSNYGSAEFITIDTLTLEEFLTKTYEWVQRGEEMLDVNGTIERILA